MNWFLLFRECKLTPLHTQSGWFPLQKTVQAFKVQQWWRHTTVALYRSTAQSVPSGGLWPPWGILAFLILLWHCRSSATYPWKLRLSSESSPRDLSGLPSSKWTPSTSITSWGVCATSEVVFAPPANMKMQKTDVIIRPLTASLVGCSDVVAFSAASHREIFHNLYRASTWINLRHCFWPMLSRCFRCYKTSTRWKHSHWDGDCNLDSGGSAPSVCLDDLFQLCNLDSCFRGEGLLTIRVMTAYELSGPSRGLPRGPVCSKQRGCDDSSAASSSSSRPFGSSQHMCKHSLCEHQQLTSHRRHPNAAAQSGKNSTVDYSCKVEQKQYEKWMSRSDFRMRRFDSWGQRSKHPWVIWQF